MKQIWISQKNLYGVSQYHILFFCWKLIYTPPQIYFPFEWETSASSGFKPQTLVVVVTLPTKWRAQHSTSWATDTWTKEHAQVIPICMPSTHPDTTNESTLYISPSYYYLLQVGRRLFCWKFIYTPPKIISRFQVKSPAFNLLELEKSYQAPRVHHICTL